MIPLNGALPNIKLSHLRGVCAWPCDRKTVPDVNRQPQLRRPSGRRFAVRVAVGTPGIRYPRYTRPFAPARARRCNATDMSSIRAKKKGEWGRPWETGPNASKTHPAPERGCIDTPGTCRAICMSGNCQSGQLPLALVIKQHECQRLLFGRLSCNFPAWCS